MKFAPLNVYTSYSFLNSALTIENITKATKKNNYEGIGIADIFSLTGAVEFVNTTEKYGLNKIIGETLFIDDYKFSFFVKNETGYRNLLKLTNLVTHKQIEIANISDYFDGLVVVISSDNEKFKDEFNNHYYDFVRFLSKVTKGYKTYIGLDSLDTSYNDKIREFAKGHSYELVAFPLVQYLKAEDAIVLKIVNAIKNEEKLNIKELKGNNYLLSEEELNHLFTSEELNETLNIISSSEFDIKAKRGELPVFTNGSYKDVDEYLRTLSYKKLEEKMGVIDDAHKNRLDYELSVIKSMGYSSYFLIVMDYVAYSKSKGILVGPGRGSAAGSLVSYALDIVKSDPLKDNLMFERFLNKDRKTMPDIDIDFMDIRRNEVVEYLKEKYGKECVANIVTIQTIGAKQSLRDIGRVFDIPTNTIDLLSKSIINDKLSLRENYKTNPTFKNLVDSDKYYLDIVKYAAKIEGLARQRGLHAAGIVLNKDSLIDIVPTIYENDNLIVGFEMNYLEEQGLLKMDLLGLRNLTIVDNCIKLINAHYGKNLTYDDIPYDDPNAIKLIASAKTMGVFQLESKGMRRSIAQIKLSSFDDLVAVLALFRPGPMEFIPNYGRRKAGKEKINYASKAMEEILSSTYGIIIYQEQIMEICTKVANFSMGEADLFRRAISKKDSNKLKALEDSFIAGAVKNKYDKYTAKKIFDLIYKFANYGFNKAHAFSYAILAGQMAYLKYYYGKEFYACVLENSSANDDTKFSDVIAELKSLNIKVISPNVNISEPYFISNKDGLVFSLTSIKGISYDVASKITKERKEHGDFTSFNDFLLRMHKNGSNISDKQVISLIHGGCFDLFNENRKELEANLLPLMEYTKLISGIDENLFNDTSFIPLPEHINVTRDRQFELENEFDVLGIIISGSIFEGLEDKLNEVKHVPINDINEHTTDYVIGKVLNVKKITTRKDKKPMAFIKIYDDNDTLEVTIFPKLYVDVANLIKVNSTIMVKGKIEKSENENEYSMIADEVKKF